MTVWGWSVAVALGTAVMASGFSLQAHAQVSLEAVSARLDEAEALIQNRRYGEAVTLYESVVNVDDRLLRAQTRYGLAVALSQLGQEEQALKTLEGTSADDSQLGQAVGDLRGRLILQLAEKSLLETGNTGRWLNDYERLLQHPDTARAERLRALEGRSNSYYGGDDTLRVGVLLPLSGPYAPVGQELLRGLQMALTSGPVWRDTKVELYPRDTESGAREAMDAVLLQGAKVIVGPLLAQDVEAIAPRAWQVDVPVLAFSSDRTVAGGNVHVVPPLPTEQARMVARWAVRNGHFKMAGLVPSNPYGYEVFDAFREEVTAQGAQVVETSFFNPQNVDLGASVRQLAGDSISGTTLISGSTFRFDSLFMPIPAASMPLATSQLAYYDVDQADIQLLGTALWQDGALLGPNATAVRGGVFAAPAKPESFSVDYSREFGSSPNGMAIQGYDIGRLLVQMAAERQWSGRQVEQLLLRPEGFYGSGGFLRFNQSGVTTRGMQIVRIGNGVFDVLQPALTMPPLPIPADLRPTFRQQWGGWW